MEVSVYLVLLATTTLYAFLLAKIKHILEPDLTILEVIVGVALCLAAPFVAARLADVPTWQAYEALTWRAFVVGGIPIAIWQFSRLARTWRRVERRIRERDGKPDTETLAEECRSSAQDDV